MLGVEKDFCPNLRNLPKKLLGQFLCEYFLIKIVFASPPKKTPFFPNKRTLAAIFARFSAICNGFHQCRIHFHGFFPDIPGFCLNFQQIKTFGGALAPLPPTPLIAAVCCNSQVHVNMLTSSRFSTIQSKTISEISESGVSLQYFKVSFSHTKSALKYTGLAHLRIPLESCGCYLLHW